MTFKSLFTFFVLLSITSLARAQSALPAKETPFEFRIIAWNFELSDLFYEQDGKERRTSLIEQNATPLFTYVSPTGKLVLYTKTLVNDTLVKIPMADLSLVPPPSKNLVLLWHEKSGRYGSAVLTDDPQTPPPGHLRLVNLTEQNLAVQCKGTAPFTLVPGTDRVVPPSNGGIGVAVKIARQRKKTDAGSWQLALMRGIAIEPNERVTAFIADPARLSLSAREQSLGDYREKEVLSFFTVRDAVAR